MQASVVMSEAVALTLTEALRAGGRLHAFRSGGGLRVVRIEDLRRLVYGEGPDLGEALFAAADDFARSRPQHRSVYLTGSGHADSAIDACLMAGEALDAFVYEGDIVAEIHGWDRQRTPPEVERRMQPGAEPVEWDDGRGHRLRATPLRDSTAYCVEMVEGVHTDAFMWETCQTGRAPGLVEALSLAVAAPKIETCNTLRPRPREEYK